MAIKVFADGANLEGMLDMYENGNVQGFTTNPSLMKKGGVTDYRAFAKEVLAHITDVSVSFEVFADDVETMEVEAREIATWAENVYVKIPCVTTKGESTAELVRKLSADGIKVNVTTIFTPTQVDEMVEAVDAETPSIISLFAGRIADTGVDPIPFMTESVKKAAAKPNCEVLWASTRELINIYQAEACGCQIITVPTASWPSARTLVATRTRSRSTPCAALPRISRRSVSISCRSANTDCTVGCSLRPFLSLSLTRSARVALGKGKAGAAGTSLPASWRLASISCRGQRYPRLRRAKLRVFSKVKVFIS